MSGKRDSNPRPSAWEANALPTELLPHGHCKITKFFLFTATASSDILFTCTPKYISIVISLSGYLPLSLACQSRQTAYPCSMTTIYGKEVQPSGHCLQDVWHDMLPYMAKLRVTKILPYLFAFYNYCGLNPD